MGKAGRPKIQRPRKPRTPITEKLKEDIVRDYHDKKYSFTDLSAKYGCCYQVCKDICAQNEYGFWNNPPALAKGTKQRPVTSYRIKLSKDDRDKQISDDALQIIELSLQKMKNLLLSDTANLSATQLRDFVNSVIPYVKVKADATSKGKEDNKGKEKSNIFAMWKEQQEKQ